MTAVRAAGYSSYARKALAEEAKQSAAAVKGDNRWVNFYRLQSIFISVDFFPFRVTERYFVAFINRYNIVTIIDWYM